MINLLVTCVPISRETSNVIVYSHIEIALFSSMILTFFVFPFSHQSLRLLDRWILAKYICLLVVHEIIYNAAKIKHVYKN